MTNNTALAGVVTGLGIGTNFPAAQTNWPFSAITNFNTFTALGSNDWWLATNVPVVDTSSFLTNLDARPWTNFTGIYGNGVGISNLDLTLAFGTNTYLLGGTNYVFVTNINDTLTGLKSVTNLIQWIINPVNGSGLVGGRLGSGVLWITLGGQPVYGYSPNSFNIYTNAFFQSSLTATNPANVLAGDGLGLTNLNPPLALGSNHWWLATNSPAYSNNASSAGVITGLGIGTNLLTYTNHPMSPAGVIIGRSIGTNLPPTLTVLNTNGQPLFVIGGNPTNVANGCSPAGPITISNSFNWPYSYPGDTNAGFSVTFTYMGPCPANIYHVTPCGFNNSWVMYPGQTFSLSGKDQMNCGNVYIGIYRVSLYSTMETLMEYNSPGNDGQPHAFYGVPTNSYTSITQPGGIGLYQNAAMTVGVTNLWFGPSGFATNLGFAVAPGDPPTLTIKNGTNGPADLVITGAITGNGAGLTNLPAVWGGLSNTAASGTNVIVANARTTIQNGGANTLVVTNGSVGLGTATPTALLTVNGPASFSNAVAIVGASSGLTIGGTVIGNTTITATTGFLLPTNYTAAAFIPTTAMGTLVISNAVLYFVTSTQTNLISDGR